MSANASVVVAALIGVGGSVLGGLVGGWFALSASSRQWRRDRADRRSDQSHQAAMEIAGAWPVLAEAFLARAADEITTLDMEKAFNAFSRIVYMQIIAITDPQVRERIRNHERLALAYGRFGDDRQKLAEYASRLHIHGESMTAALEAHYANAPLPPYQGPPAGDGDAILAWEPSSEAS